MQSNPEYGWRWDLYQSIMHKWFAKSSLVPQTPHLMSKKLWAKLYGSNNVNGKQRINSSIFVTTISLLVKDGILVWCNMYNIMCEMQDSTFFSTPWCISNAKNLHSQRNLLMHDEPSIMNPFANVQDRARRICAKPRVYQCWCTHHK